MSDNKRIAKNTLFLYVRMFIIMGVTLFTSRVILDKLGADDFGLYNVVGGVVGMLGFLNGTLSISTSRFITYSLGEGSKNNLAKTFSTAFYTHAILGLLVILILETVGLWFVYNKLVISDSRMSAALIVYQISIITSFISITQVPYTSAIIAHEKMNIYAYISVFEAFSKLLIVYLLSISKYDKLILYAVLLAFVQFLIAVLYRIYSTKHYEECKLRLIFDRAIFKNMLSFSGWNITANVAEMLKLQGVIILINMFFQPAIVAAQAIGNQITNAMMQFVNNVRTAINPQIIKLYAAGEHEGSKKLTLESTVYIFDLLLLLGLPAILLMKPILNLWLVKVPPYTVIFSQFIIVQQIIENFNASFYIPMMASGKVRKNSIAAVLVSFSQFLILYIILKLGGSVMWIPYIATISALIWGYIVKPYILHKELNYTFNELLNCYIDCSKVLIIPLIVMIPLRYYLPDTLIGNIVILLISLFVVVFSALLFMNKSTRFKLYSFVKGKLIRKI